MKDYKETLNLPITEFKMKGNLGESEPIREKKWQNIKLYQKRLKQNKNNQTFFLHDGPPYANGNIHAGHSLNKILKDFIIRYKSMKGFYAPYIPGWDTHGLPIENELKKQKITPQNKSIIEFRQECEKYALKQVDKQKAQFLRLGVLGDFDNPYLTLNKEYESNEIKLFAKLVKEGLIYRGLKPVYWSYANKTALAEAEIIYENVDSTSIYVKFLITNPKIKDLENASLVIWTTTPWTLPANLAVSINPKFIYGLYETEIGKILLLTDLSEKLFKEFNIKKAKLIKEFIGKELEFTEYIHPLYDKKCPVILGEHVLNTDGTGLVHTAPGHGTDDYNVGLKYKLEIFSPVDDRGFLTEDAGKFANLFYEDANIEIIKELKNKNLLVKERIINHAYPHDWRSKKPVIFRATPQWFCNISKLLPDIKKSLSKVNFIPSWGKGRLLNMMENRTDWCISRQRTWGVPIPILYNEKDEPILDEKIINLIADKIKKEGTNYWYLNDHNNILSKKELGKYKVSRKETDTLDVWFDSGTSFLTSKLDIDLYLEGSDQFRGWFNSSLVNAVAYYKKAPYKNVISHGFVLDQKGQKMSKSLGNVVDPNDVCKTLGADVLRLWVSQIEYTSDVPLSNDLLKQTGDSYRKIRNTFKYLLGNLNDFNFNENYISYSMRDQIDRIMTVKLNKLIQSVIAYYDEYNFIKIFRDINAFIVNDLSQFYLDTAKDSIYVLEKNNHKRRSMQSVLYDSLLVLLKLLTPIIPHTTSEAYEYLKNKKYEDIYLSKMPEYKKFPQENEYLETYEKFQNIRSYILKELENKRNEGLIKKSLEAEVSITLNSDNEKVLNNLKTDLTDLLMIAKLNITVKEIDDILVSVKKAKGTPCERCWNIKEKLNSDGLCDRCEKILEKIK